jgi:hypothetical protein
LLDDRDAERPLLAPRLLVLDQRVVADLPDLVLFDRNNHKAAHHGALFLGGGIPIFLETDRNAYGPAPKIWAASFCALSAGPSWVRRSPRSSTELSRSSRIARGLVSRVTQYAETLKTPFFGALVDYAEKGNQSSARKM